MPPPVHILHVHAAFGQGDPAGRCVRLINAFGDRARHTIVSEQADQLGARDGIAPGIRYEIAQNAPSLTGGPSVARYEALARFMRRFDLVLTYGWGAIDGVMARRVFAKGMPPLVHHEDGFDADEAAGQKIERIFYRRLALAAADALVVPSETLEAIALRSWKQPAGRVRRIANAIDTARYAAKPDPKAIPGFRRKPGEVVIGALAGLDEVKDLPALVRAAGGVSSRVRLVIVGDGPDRARILGAAEAMDMADRLHLPGFLPDPHRYVGLFDILALSSKSEQCPVAVIYGMAAGLPIVAPRIGDIARMVSDTNAGYIMDRSEVRLRDALQALAGCAPAARAFVGAQNRVKAMAEYDESGMIARYTALYEAVMGRPGALG
ncbi:glycosyltransferase family 4 protein [Sphingomonas sp. ZT3P38]|uniref:glycosyltransferase family 4 protein n=1 Tax=Parasphingomonas zepuensis TaxID=3096161 RepID=UPI002FC5FE8B